jgi:predicted nucleic acid-binding protein
MIIIDASVVYDSFDDNRLLRQIIEAPQAIKAPKLIIREILGLRGQIEKDYNLSHKQFDFIWKTLSQKTNIEDVNQFYRSQSEKIITELNLI